MPFNIFAEPILARPEKIYEIFTEATGNNKYEAKVKALDKAKYRAFLMLADKMMFKDEGLKNISREDLNGLFSYINIREEDTRAYLSGSSYKSIVQFTFLQSKVNEAIEKYASPSSKEKVLEAVVIPDFKINHLETIGKDKLGWLSSWRNKKEELFANRILLYDTTQNSNEVINVKTIYKLTYEDYLDYLPYKLFHRVIIPIGEFYTDKNSGTSYFRVKYITQSMAGRSEEIIDYNIYTKDINLQKFFASIINDFVKKSGKPRNPEYSKIQDQASIINHINFQESNDQFYIFLVEIDYGDEENEIKNKLHGIKEIDRFTFDIDYKLGRRVKVYTKLDMLELTENYIMQV